MSKFMVEILVNGNPSIASTTEFRSGIQALEYAQGLCSEMKEIEAYRIFETGWGAPRRTQTFPPWIPVRASGNGDEREEIRERLSGSIKAQDDLMMMDIAKVLHKMPEGSSVVALRNYRGMVFAGLVVPNGDITLTTDLYGKGLLNPEAAPGNWRLVPQTKFDLLKEFTNPTESALAFFVLTPSGEHALAFSHLVRSDGDVHWISKTDYISRVADVLLEIGLLQGQAQ